MTKNSIYSPADKLNPLFQQHQPHGRVQSRDHAFFMRKHSFMQQQQQAPQSKRKNCSGNSNDNRN
jgi:hypothetical protein